MSNALHWPAAASVFVTVLGAVLSPCMLAVLPGPWAVGLTVFGAVCQAFTGPLPRRSKFARSRRADHYEVEP